MNLSTGASPQITKLDWNGWVELRKMLFDVLESDRLTTFLSIVVGVIRKESATGSGEVADSLLAEGDFTAAAVGKAMAIDWDAVIEAGIPALAQSASELNELDAKFVSTFVSLCSTLDADAIKTLPALDVYRVFDAVSEENSLIEHVRAEKNLWAALLSVLSLSDDE